MFHVAPMRVNATESDAFQACGDPQDVCRIAASALTHQRQVDLAAIGIDAPQFDANLLAEA